MMTILPATERMWRFLIPQMCWRPKSRIWVHHLGEDMDEDEEEEDEDMDEEDEENEDMQNYNNCNDSRMSP